MEKRIGTAILLINKRDNVSRLNSILSEHAEVILGRQGIPVTEQGVHIISLVLYGTTNDIGSLTGQLGRLDGIKVKSVLIKND
ncbi:MAG: hypothetical protein K9I94_03595 [Bacteroidales bacterium]|nr:hypothetical protein [Bacteroidales bacterium]